MGATAIFFSYINILPLVSRRFIKIRAAAEAAHRHPPDGY
jgi:hypothetical protein